VRVDAPISSTNGDEAGRPRAKLLEHLQSIPQFNRQHAVQQFDGVHLDIEPQPRAENKGPGNRQFLPDRVETYRAVQALTDRAALSLMPYELSIPDDSYNDVLAGARAPASP